MPTYKRSHVVADDVAVYAHQLLERTAVRPGSVRVYITFLRQQIGKDGFTSHVMRWDMVDNKMDNV